MSDARPVPVRQSLNAEAPAAFDGFPYLVTRIVASLHHILLLPSGWDVEHLVTFVLKQVQANRLPACLVLAEDLCVYFSEDGSGQRSSDIPRGVKIASEKLQAAAPVPDSAELSIRRMKLILTEEEQKEGPGATIIMGDLTKGGRYPTTEESEKLAGTHADGVPRGLLPCLQCGEWRGECFDTLPTGLVVRVHCRCENNNRCARCGGLLDDRKLNANYFKPEDGKIWHVPGFCGFHHHCPDEKGE